MISILKKASYTSHDYMNKCLHSLYNKSISLYGNDPIYTVYKNMH